MTQNQFQKLDLRVKSFLELSEFLNIKSDFQDMTTYSLTNKHYQVLLAHYVKNYRYKKKKN